MDPIKDYFTKKKSENPDFFKNASKELVLADIEKETGAKIKNIKVLDIWYNKYSVFEKKKTPSESVSSSTDTIASLDSKGFYFKNQNNKDASYLDGEFKAVEEKNAALKKEVEKDLESGFGVVQSEPRTESYDGFDIEAHQGKVKKRIRSVDDVSAAKGRGAGSLSLREQMDKDIAAGRNIAKGAQSDFDLEEWDRQRIEKVKKSQGFVLTEEESDDEDSYSFKGVMSGKEKPFQKKKEVNVKTPQTTGAQDVPQEDSTEPKKSGIVKLKNLTDDIRSKKKELFQNQTLEKIDADFIQRDEKVVEAELTKLLLNQGFKINQSKAFKGAIEITSANGNKLEVILDMPSIEKKGDQLTEYVAGSRAGGRSAKEYLEIESRALELRKFIKENSIATSYVYYDIFKENPSQAVEKIYNDIVAPGVSYYRFEDIEIDSADYNGLSSQIKEFNKKIDDLKGRLRFKHGNDSSAFPIRKELKRIGDQRDILVSMKQRNVSNRSKYSQTISELMQINGGVENLFDLSGENGKNFMSSIQNMGVDAGDIRLNTLKIEGVPVSFNEFKEILTDYDLRNEFLEGDIDVEISNSESLGVLNEYIDNALALKERQEAGFGKTLMKTLYASTVEVMGSTKRTLNEMAAFLYREGSLLFAGDSEEDRERVEEALGTWMELDHNRYIDEAKRVRLETPEISGGFIESESFGELMYKGTKAAVESAPITATFLVAPEVGLALTGLSSYGRNIQELEEIRKYIKQTGDPEGIYDNINLTRSRARGLAASKAIGETALTYFFTYNFLKGLNTSSSALRNLSIQEAKKQISFYAGSTFGNVTNVMAKSVMNEIKEENIITATNMWIDEIYGLRKYTFTDYAKAIGETSLSVPFMSMPLSVVGYRKLNRSSKKTVHNLIARASWDTEMHNKLDMHRKLDRDITEAEAEGKKLDDATYKKRDELSEEIVKKNDDIISNLEKNATHNQIVALAKNQNMIASNASQIKRSDIGDFSKKAAEEKIYELLEENNKILSEISDSELSKSATELAEKAMSEIQDNLTEEEQAEIDKYKNDDEYRPSTKNESTARQLAATTFSYEKKFDADTNPEEIERVKKLRKFLYELKDSDINDFTRQVLVETKEALEEGKGIDRVYNSIVKANEIVYEIVKENVTNEKIKPLTKIESSFTGVQDKKGIDLNIATVNHAITMLLKNDRMASPLRKLSGGIDAKLVKIQSDGRAAINSFYEMEFIDGFVSKERKKKFLSDESDVERMFLAEMLKQELGVDAEKNFLIKKKMMFDNINKLRKDMSSYGESRAQTWEKVYNNLLGSAESASEMLANASMDNVKAVDWLQKQFRPIEDSVLKHMENYYGRVPTRFTNYLPSFYSLQQDGTARETNDLGESLYGPSAMMETLSIDDLAETNRMLIADNWTKMTFRAMENATAEYTLRADLDALEGVIKSKAFEDLFDTTTKTLPGLNKTGTDFTKLTGIIDQKINSINKIIQSNGAVENDSKALAEELLNLFTKQVSARRLSTLSMRAAQGYSAMMAVSPLLSTRANQMMYNNLIKFTAGSLTSDIKSNEGLQNVLSMSATQGRSGLEPLSSGYSQKFYRKIAVTKGRRAVDNAIKTANDASDFIMKKTLAESDKIAGQASFAALYYERMLQKNPSKIQDMSYDQFWAWSSDSKNVDLDAVTWADSQIDRSQMQAMSWNQGNLFNKRALANVLFPFGRFAYNRKAGMANDWAILNDKQTASEADKARALRRLASAAVEIGVFKTIQPLFSIALTKAMIPLLAGLVGWDDEYDRIAKEAMATFNSLDPRRVINQMNPFAISNYERNASREFKTQMFEGMLPTPVPSFLNEVVMMGINTGAKMTGYSDDDIFNVYSKDIRDMFSGEAGGAISESETLAFFMSNSGLLGMALEDVVKIGGAFNAFNGRMPSLYGSKDPYIKKQAMPGAEVLGYVRLANSVVPLADMNRFANKLESLIQRKYTTTVPQNYDEE